MGQQSWLCVTLSLCSLRQEQWMNVRVGDIIKLENNQFVAVSLAWAAWNYGLLAPPGVGVSLRMGAGQQQLGCGDLWALRVMMSDVVSCWPQGCSVGWGASLGDAEGSSVPAQPSACLSCRLTSSSSAAASPMGCAT